MIGENNPEEKDQKVLKIQKQIRTDVTALDQLLQANKGKTLMALKEMMENTDLAQSQESNRISDKINQIVKPSRKERFTPGSSDELHKSIFLKYFQQAYTSQGFEVIFQNKSNPQSQLSIKAVSSGMHLNYMSVVEQIDEKQCQWKKNELTDPNKKVLFENWYRERVRKQFNLKDDDICEIQVKLTNRNIMVGWLTTQGAILEYFSKRNPSYKLETHKLLKKLYIAEEDYFSLKGNNNFSEISEKRGVLECGRWPYYQPTVGRRLGVNALMYGEDTSWLHKGQQQWAVGFHGVGSPDDLMEKDLTRLKNIIKTGLKPGKRQLYTDEKKIGVNTGKQIERGVYFSPHFQIAMGYTNGGIQIEGKLYYVLLQCRLNPKAIQVCPNEEYNWVVSDPKDIRLYGIIIINQEDAEKYEISPVKTHGEQFNYENYRCQIENKWDEFYD